MNETRHLIQACINGNRAAQNRLYELFADKMFGVCVRYSKNRVEAEDIMQEGFMQVYKSLHQFTFAGSFEGWIRKIMVNCAIQTYRAKTKIHPIVEMDHTQSDQPSNEDILAKIHKKELLRMVQNLPPAYRLVFNLFVFEGFKHREIAALLHISEGTSKSNLFDAKILLQKAVVNSLKISNNY